MKKSLKSRWLKALRSGEYKQARGNLEVLNDDGSVNGNCCLGVLCRVAKIKAVRPRKAYFIKFRGSSDFLPKVLLKEFGLTEEEHEILYTMNDAEGRWFSTIANWIEKNIPVTK